MGFVASVLLLAGCASEPDPMTDPLLRAKALEERRRAAEAAQRERDRVELEKQARREREGRRSAAEGTSARGAEIDLSGGGGAGAGSTGGGASTGGASTTLGLKTGPSTSTALSDGPWKRDLLARYGPRLTPFQRSALQSARLASLADGEKMCERWVEDNRRFDAGLPPARSE